MNVRTLAAVALTVCTANIATADEVTVIAPGGIKAAIEKLIPEFERKTGHTVKATFGSGLGTKRQVANGAPFDVPIVQPPYPDVIASGHVVTSSPVLLANVAVGLAVRTGAKKPDISTPEKFKQVMLAAVSISYPDPEGGAAAGVSFTRTLEQLGIADQMKPKIKLAQGGAAAMATLARGEVELGLTLVSEIISEPGVEAVGPLPKAISTPTTLVAFLSAHAKSPEAAKALMAFLSSPEAAPVYKAVGMQPGR